MSEDASTICNYEDHELKLDPRVRTMMNSNIQNQSVYCTKEGCTFEKSVRYHPKEGANKKEAYCHNCDRFINFIGEPEHSGHLIKFKLQSTEKSTVLTYDDAGYNRSNYDHNS